MPVFRRRGDAKRLEEKATIAAVISPPVKEDTLDVDKENTGENPSAVVENVNKKDGDEDEEDGPRVEPQHHRNDGRAAAKFGALPTETHPPAHTTVRIGGGGMLCAFFLYLLSCYF